jgi:hypothetical protein
MSDRRLIFLVALMLVLGGVLLFDQDWWGDSNRSLPGAVAAISQDSREYTARVRLRATASQLAAVNPLGDWPAEALSEVLERPLFNPSRRAYMPPEPEPQPAPEPEPVVVEEPLDVTLVGVLLGENGRFAMLRENGSGKVLRLKEGQSFEEWVLREVGLREALLVRGERSKTLRLFDKVPPASNSALGTSDDAAGRSDQPVEENELKN